MNRFCKSLQIKVRCARVSDPAQIPTERQRGLPEQTGDLRSAPRAGSETRAQQQARFMGSMHSGAAPETGLPINQPHSPTPDWR